MTLAWGSFFLGVVAAFGLSTLACLLLGWRAAAPGRRPRLRLLPAEETPQEDCRNALAILDELQRQVLHVGLLIGTAGDVATYELLRLLATARGRVWAAVAKLEGS